ncbi:hypothetical protein KC644_00075 [Candidatus Berkelbacteria bacterium]|nr:hypothetical protein [Candidatus Berkelbacteria bacterium]
MRILAAIAGFASVFILLAYPNKKRYAKIQSILGEREQVAWQLNAAELKLVILEKKGEKIQITIAKRHEITRKILSPHSCEVDSMILELLTGEPESYAR